MSELATLDQVKNWLNPSQQSFGEQDDQLLQQMITAASDFVEQYCSRVFEVTTWVEVQDGKGNQALNVTNPPIIQVPSLTIDGLIIPAAPTDGGFVAGYLFNDKEIIVRDYFFSRRKQNVIFTYQAGFRTIPPSIVEAVCGLVGWRYRQRTRVGEVSIHYQDGSTTAYSQKDMDGLTSDMLKPYRRVALPYGFCKPAPVQLP